MKVPTALEIQIMDSFLTHSDDQFTILSCYRLQEKTVKCKQKLKYRTYRWVIPFCISRGPELYLMTVEKRMDD